MVNQQLNKYNDLTDEYSKCIHEVTGACDLCEKIDGFEKYLNQRSTTW